VGLRRVAIAASTAVAHPLRFHHMSRSSPPGVTAFRTHGIARREKDAPEESTMSLITYLRALMNRDEGQDLLEYALLVALIALVAVGAIGLAGTNVNLIFGRIATALTAPAA
jgi:Flp pilus assembly pilin Flp